MEGNSHRSHLSLSRASRADRSPELTQARPIILVSITIASGRETATSQTSESVNSQGEHPARNARFPKSSETSEKVWSPFYAGFRSSAPTGPDSKARGAALGNRKPNLPQGPTGRHSTRPASDGPWGLDRIKRGHVSQGCRPGLSSRAPLGRKSQRFLRRMATTPLRKSRGADSIGRFSGDADA